jgi:uncharacterized SAM-binding protein YcdF (DUF218 family)
MKKFILIIMTVACALQPLVTEAREPKQVFDAVIIPGFPFQPGEKMNAIYRMRLAWAFELYKTGRTKHIILSGGAVHSPYVEAEIFALYLMKAGIPAEALILERNAEHSMENVFYSMEIARKYGFENVAVATDFWQSGMIMTIGKLYGHDLSDVAFLPAKFYVVNHYWKSFEFDIDEEQAKATTFVPLVERKNKETRKLGTHGKLWKPSDTVELTFASERLIDR